MEKIKEALMQLPHIQKVWVSIDGENACYYRPKNGFKEMSRDEILNENVKENISEEKPKIKNKK